MCLSARLECLTTSEHHKKASLHIFFIFGLFLDHGFFSLNNNTVSKLNYFCVFC